MGPCLSLTASVIFPTLLMYLSTLLGWWDEVCLEVMGGVTSADTGFSWTRLKTMLFICSAFACLLQLLSLPWYWNRVLNLVALLSAFDHIETLLLTPLGPGFALLGASIIFSATSAHAGTFQPLQNTQTKHSSCIHQLSQLLGNQ